MPSPAKPQVYAFANNIIALNGISLNGFDDGDDVVKCTPNAPISEAVIGADGTVSYSDSADQTYKVEITLLQTSPANKYMRDIERRQRTIGATQIALTLSIVDLYRRDRCTATGGRMVELPEVAHGKKAGKRTWKFFFAQGVPVEAATPPLAG